MTTSLPSDGSTPNRRDFLKTSGTALATGAVAQTLSNRAFAAESEILKVGLVGCGGRGTGAAAQALTADSGARLVAMADAYPDRLESSLRTLQNQPIKSQIEMTEDHKFVGFDGYKGLIDAVDVVLLATPPHFRPAQLKAAIDAGKHVFAEKPVAVDAPGVRSVMETCRQAKEKNLSVVSGLCWRYHEGMRATFDQIHEGLIGDVTATQVSYNTRGLWFQPRRDGWSDLDFQVRNWLYYTWLSGDHIAEQHVHSLDKLAWAMGDRTPVSASGTGGRETRTDEKYGNIYDHFAIVYEYDNGIKGFGRCRQQDGCAVDVSDHVFGTKGRMDVFRHTAFGYDSKPMWRYRGPKSNMYQLEHDALFKSIRDAEPINNGEYMTKSTMLAILGRMAAYSGQKVTWDQAWNSDEVLGPQGYDDLDFDAKDVAKPGITQLT